MHEEMLGGQRSTSKRGSAKHVSICTVLTQHGGCCIRYKPVYRLTFVPSRHHMGFSTLAFVWPYLRAIHLKPRRHV